MLLESRSSWDQLGYSIAIGFASFTTLKSEDSWILKMIGILQDSIGQAAPHSETKMNRTQHGKVGLRRTWIHREGYDLQFQPYQRDRMGHKFTSSFPFKEHFLPHNVRDWHGIWPSWSMHFDSTNYDFEPDRKLLYNMTKKLSPTGHLQLGTWGQQTLLRTRRMGNDRTVRKYSLWFICGLFVVYLWFICGLFMVHLYFVWLIYGLFLDYLLFI